MILDLFLLLALLILILLLSMFWPPDSPWAPNWGTSKKIARAESQLAGVSEKDLVYDLGSGGGLALITAAKEFGARGVGIEIDPIRFWISKLRSRHEKISNKIIFKRGNLFDENLSDASVVFVYLVPKALDKLIPKFKKELKKGTRVVSFRYEMKLPLLRKDEENKLFLYSI